MRRLIAVLKGNTRVVNLTRMTLRAKGLAFCLIMVTGFTLAAPSVKKEWSACDNNDECTSVEGGCYYWQPVNRYYANAMKTALFTSCKKSIDPGPQPISSCVSHLCVNNPYTMGGVNPYTVKQWTFLETHFDDQGIRFQLVGERINECLQAGAMVLSQLAKLTLTNHYTSMIDAGIHKNRFSEDKPMFQVIKSVISCEDVVSRAKSLQKEN